MKKYSPQTIKLAEKVLLQIANKSMKSIPAGKTFSLWVWKHHCYPEERIDFESSNFTRSSSLLDIYNEVM